MFDTKAHLQQLIAELERDIAERPDRRLSDLAALKAAWAAISAEVASPSPGSVASREEWALRMANPAPRGYFAAKAAEAREGSKKLTFRKTVDDLLKARIDQRVHRQDIIAKCRDLGMFGETKDLDRDVSKYLSNDGTFAPDGDGFWKKKDQQALSGSH